MTWKPTVKFATGEGPVEHPTDQEIDKKLAEGVVSNTGLSTYQALNVPASNRAHTRE